MPTVNIRESDTQLSHLVDLASTGADVVIARNGTPVARLTAIPGKEQRMRSLGLLKGKGWIADDFDDPLPPDIQAQFEGE